MTTLVTVSQTPAAVLTWETKSGKTRAAHTATGAQLAPRATRIASAAETDVDRLQNGQYRPFIRDAVAHLKTGELAALRAHVMASLSTIVDGVAMAPVGDAFQAPNKRLALAVAEFMVNPSTIKATGKGAGRVEVQSATTFKGAAAALADVAALWLGTIAAAEAAKAAASAATTAPATSDAPTAPAPTAPATSDAPTAPATSDAPATSGT